MNNKSLKIFIQLLILIVLCFILSGCVPGDGTNSIVHTAGFFSGVWHGWIAPFTLIYSLFDSRIGIYEIYNNGFAYNLGFYMAVISGFGSLAFSRRKKNNEMNKS